MNNLKTIYFNPNNFFWSVDDGGMKSHAEELLDNDTIKTSNEGVIHEVRLLILQNRLKFDEIEIKWIREDLDRIDTLYFDEYALVKGWPIDFCSRGMLLAQSVLKEMIYKRNPKLRIR